MTRDRRLGVIRPGFLPLRVAHDAWGGAPTDQLKSSIDKVIKILGDPAKEGPRPTWTAGRKGAMPQTKAVVQKLFKAHHPRAIDRYIDYFGGRPAAGVTPENDPCGEGLLDALASRRI